MSQKLPAKRRYTQEDIDYALTVVALCAGRTQYASDALAQEGKNIPQGTLDNWKHHTDGRYARIQEAAQDQIAQKIAAGAEAVALRAQEIETELLEELAKKKGELRASEVAGAVRNITTTKSLNVEKIVNPLRGRASTITEHRDANEILRSLASRLPKAIDGTAEEITEAEKPKDAEVVGVSLRP
jgi:hypothetical protein